MKKYNRFMELFWLAVSIVSAVGVVYFYFIEGADDHPIILSMPFMAFFLFIIRRWFRKRIENDKREDQSRN